MQNIALDDEYWSQRYQEKSTKWDIGSPSPALTGYFKRIKNKKLRILVPGCGNAHEAKFLLEKGFKNVTLIDISSVLVKSLQEELKTYIDQGFCKVIHTDFFDHTGTYDLVMEQTFLCAIDPILRPKYVEKMDQLLAVQGQLIGLLFDREFEGGPPFSGSKDEFQKLFEKTFLIKSLDLCRISIPSRQGSELFVNLLKK